MRKIVAVASVALLLWGTASVNAKTDTEVGGDSDKGVATCCSQFQKFADNKTVEIGRSKRAASDDYDPKSNATYKCGTKVCIYPERGTGSTGPTAPPKPVGSQK